INIEIISSTKYISGGATSIGGLIIDYGNYDWSVHKKFKDLAIKHGPFTFHIKLRREVYRNLGACLSPHNAYLQSIGLETFALRTQKATDNCYQLAKHLQNINSIIAVNYPGLKTSSYFDIANKQFIGNPGSILTFNLKSKEACFRFLDNLKIIKRATNLHDNKTLIIHPASTIFSDFDENTKLEMSISNSMIRLSVGIEDIEDLIYDIEQALNY
ncbi:MAG: PLP-dependent transferase, partial [Bacteroidales bacterium]|nr:PLP-dependent transferase [Bacteroidales bacterium]